MKWMENIAMTVGCGKISNFDFDSSAMLTLVFATDV
jgi:hypothetical protein